MQVKEIEKRDSVLTSKQQIDRLLRPGASYFNLNPYEVLQLDPDTPLDEAKKKYKRVSMIYRLMQIFRFKCYIFSFIRVLINQSQTNIYNLQPKIIF